MVRRIPEERRRAILAGFRDRPLIKTTELSSALGASMETVRRDLIALEQEGHLRRVYGGATGISTPRAFESPFEKRSVEYRDRKVLIARVAADLIEPDDSIILDGGTTVAEVVRTLATDYQGKILTTSLLLATELAARERVEVLLSGGRLRPGDLICSGAVTEEFFRDFFADKAFLASGGVDPVCGLTDYWSEEIPSRRVMITHAAQSYVLADSSKLGRVAFGKVCDLSAITAVITDDQADANLVRQLEENGVTVLIGTSETGSPNLRTPEVERRSSSPDNHSSRSSINLSQEMENGYGLDE